MLRQTLSQVQSMRQEQIMAPQQIQSLEILLATTQELEQKISEEISENPTLELVGHGTEDLVGNPVEQGETNVSPDQEEAAAQAAERDETLAALIELGAPWQDYAYTAGSVRRYTEEDEERRQYMLDSLVSATTLQDVLLAQIRQTAFRSRPVRLECFDRILSRLGMRIAPRHGRKGRHGYRLIHTHPGQFAER